MIDPATGWFEMKQIKNKETIEIVNLLFAGPELRKAAAKFYVKLHTFSTLESQVS